MSGRDPQALAQWEEARRWFAKADEDIRIAALGLAADPPLMDPAAYHCQQAAVQAPRTHDLEALASLASPLYPALAAQIDWFIPLTEWATAARYPDFVGGLGADIADIADALARLKAFRQTAAALGPPSL